MICSMEKLSRDQHEVLIGILLGDANLQTESRGRTYRLRVSQAEQNRDYLFALYEIFKPMVSTPPRLDSLEPTKHTGAGASIPHSNDVSVSTGNTSTVMGRRGFHV